MKLLERLFEAFLWRTRWMVLFAVIFSLFAALGLFIVASVEIFEPIRHLFENRFHISAHEHELIVGTIVGAIDLYLIATVLIIFSLGLYELFISKIDEAESDENSSKILAIHSLDDLKEKLAKVVLMVLIVTFFKYAIHIRYKTPVETLYLAAGVLMLALALYFSHKKH
ncbi:YqhA family protein [Thermovibrio sp.]